MKIHKLSIPMKEFKKIPRDELVLFVQATKVLNDINLLHKSATMSLKNNKTECQVTRQAQLLQCHFFIFLLAGKMNEAWELLQKSYFGNRLSKEYQNLLPPEALESLNKIKTQFSKENVFRLVRNSVAFHYDSEKIINQIETMPNNEKIELYLHCQQGNSFFPSSYTYVFYMIQEFVGLDKPIDAVNYFLDSIFRVLGDFTLFFQAIAAIVSDRHLVQRFPLKEIDIDEPIHLDDVVFPFFIAGTSTKE